MIELIVVIAVIAAIATVIVPRVSRFESSARDAVDLRQMQIWNDSYRKILAADPNFVLKDWESASTDLATGVSLVPLGVDVVIRCPVPTFTRSGDPEFLAGTGIIAPPE